MKEKSLLLQEVFIKNLWKVLHTLCSNCDEELSIQSVMDRLAACYEVARNNGLTKVGRLYVAPTDFFEKSSGQRLFFAVEQNRYAGCTSPFFFKAFCKAGDSLINGYVPTVATTRRTALFAKICRFFGGR